MIRVEFPAPDQADVRIDGRAGRMVCARGEDGYWKPVAFDLDGDRRDLPIGTVLSSEVQDAILHAEST